MEEGSMGRLGSRGQDLDYSLAEGCRSSALEADTCLQIRRAEQ
jgi:hypothetical protein